MSGEPKSEDGSKLSSERNDSGVVDPEKAQYARRTEHGEPFGNETDAEVKYRTLEWWQAGMIMIAESISIGILSLPSVLATIGLVPGVILIVGLGIIATYTGYVYGQFKEAYPHVHNMADAGEVMFGSVGRELFGAAQVIFLIFGMGSHILTFTIALNAITGHATCTIVWAVIGTVVLFLFTLPRTLKNVSHFSIASAISILAAIIITMVGVGVEAPDATVQATVRVGFAPAFQATTNIVFAYAGHLAYFSFISEMKQPKDFPKALYMVQITEICLYTLSAIVIYRYAGPMVASPALGSTAPVVKKVAYGIALPTIAIAGVIYAHVAAKYVYVRLFRGTRHMSKTTWLSVGSWVGIITALWIIAFIIAESIPTFNDLLALISSLFVSWFTYGIAGIFWLFINRGKEFRTWRKVLLTVVNILLIVLGAAICGIGLYASGKAVHDNAKSSSSWSCADNSI